MHSGLYYARNEECYYRQDIRCKAGFMVHNAVKVVTGGDEISSIVAAESSGRAKWGGGELRSRGKSPKVIPQGGGWTVEGSPYAGTPLSSLGTIQYIRCRSEPFTKFCETRALGIACSLLSMTRVKT